MKEGDHSIKVIDVQNHEVIKVIKTQDKSSKINEEKVDVLDLTEFECDGLYEINAFNMTLFKSDEIQVVYSNFNLNNINVDYKVALLEIKLNSNKINDIISQLRSDKEIIVNFIKDKIIYIGFVNLIEENITLKI